MKFNRLRLTNFGAFYGNYDLDLKTNSDGKNVVLFGGKNGSGKTTILEAIRLALFGPLSYGYKTESNPYFEKINSKLNSHAKKNKEGKYQIILDFEMVENLEKNLYTLRRSWQINRNTIKEDVEIQRNHRILSSQEKEVFQTKLREETPPQLLELCLFDGEKIAQVISDEILSTYLKETARIMFNLDLFENLESDLQNFLKQESITGTLSTEQKEFFELEENIQLLQKRRQSLLFEREKIEKIVEDKKATIAQFSKQYEVHGGLVKEQREALINELNDLEQERRLMMEQNKELISTLFPFALVGELLHDATVQMEQESKHELVESLEKVTNNNSFEPVIQTLISQGFMEIKKNRDKISGLLLKGFMDHIKVDSSNSIHRASFQQRVEVNTLYNQVCNFNPTEINRNFKKNAEMLKKVQEIRKRLHDNDSTSELHTLLKDMNETNNEITALRLSKEQLEVNLTDLEQQITELNKTYEQFKTRLVKARKTENVFLISKNVLEVSKTFRSVQMRKKLQQVEIETARMLQLIFRKELFVVRVFIHPETFQLRLFDSNNEEINKDNLSAGEKQILLLSTIWAMAMCSKRRLPFVFDTLFGRLDQTHKKSIIQHFLPRCGEQVIILSTDSEVDQEHYKVIKSYVAKTYTIDFNTKKSTIDLSKSYFTYSEQEEDVRNELSS